MAEMDKLSFKEQCNYCSKKVSKKSVKCTKCDKVYHNSCAARVLCCGSKLNNSKPVNSENEVLVSDSDEDDLATKTQDLENEIKQLKKLNKDLINENNELKSKNKNLHDEISQYQSQSNQCLSLADSEKRISETLKLNIGLEMKKITALLQEELDSVKSKINKLEKLNTQAAYPDTKSKSDKQPTTKKANIQTPTKTVSNKIKPETPKQREFIKLLNEQKKIMNDVINLGASTSSCDQTNNHTDVQDENNFTQVKTRRQRAAMNKENSFKNNQKKQVIVGNAEPDEEKFSAVQVNKRTWIHVANFNRDITAEDLANYLNKKFQRNDFLCFKIKPKHKWPKFSSFKIGADISLEDVLLNPKSWAAGISVSKFDFFRAARNRILFEKRSETSG